MAKNQKSYTPEFKQQIVDLYLTHYTVSQLCGTLKFLRSTYYKALVCVPSNRQKKYEEFTKR